MNQRYPWLAVYRVVSELLAVALATVALLAAAAVYVMLAERGQGLALLAAAGTLAGGLFTAATVGVAADVARWMVDLLAAGEEQRDLLRRNRD